MNQPYLDIARRYLASSITPGAGHEVDFRPPQPIEASSSIETMTPPISLAAYRDSTTPRCRLCGHSMSVIAISDICGRCAARQFTVESETMQYTEEERLRGLALVALDKRDYPGLRLVSGKVGPGLVAWCPVLREMNEAELRDLLRRLDHVKQGKEEEAVDDVTPGLW